MSLYRNISSCLLAGRAFFFFNYVPFPPSACTSTAVCDSSHLRRVFYMYPAWEPLEVAVLVYSGVKVYYGTEFYYFKDNR